MSYRIYLLRRFLHIIPVLVGLSILIFVLARIMPGDAARLALGPEASPEQVEKLRREMGLDRSLVVQYLHYMRGVLQGDLGTSLVTFHSVTDDLLAFFPATLELTTVAMGLAIAVGIPLGIFSALAKDRWTDHFIRLFALSGVAIPRFWLGILFQLGFAYYLGLLPIFGRIDASIPPPAPLTGLYLVDSLLTLNLAAFGSSLKHILLPALTLALSPIAQIMRLVRASMIEQTRKDYILLAYANGLPRSLIVYKYMLKNAFTSVLTIIGLLYGFFLGGSFLVETVFTWPGMARYGIRGLLHKDFNAVVGVTLMVGIGYSFINFLVDICYGYLDPRIRYGEER